MSKRFRLRHYIFSLLGVLLLTLIVSGTLAVRAFSSSQAGFDNGKSVGEAFINTPEGIVIGKVGNQSLFLSEFLQSKRSVESNLDYMRRQIAGGNRFADELQARIDLIEDAGVSNVALGSLISDLALQERALAQGFSVTQDEVAEYIASVRGPVEQGNANPSIYGYIDAVGQDRYWNEVLPAIASRQLPIENMNRSFREGLPSKDLASQKRIWNNFQQAIVEQTPIQLLREDLVGPANVQNALAYLEAYWAYDGAGRVKSPTPPDTETTWNVSVRRLDGSVETYQFSSKPGPCNEVDGNSGQVSLCDNNLSKVTIALDKGEWFVITSPGAPLPGFPK